MTKEDRKVVYSNAWLKYGPRSQIVVAIEEMSECQKELCKMLRKGSLEWSDELSEEVADTMIMLEQLIWFFSADTGVENFMEYKVRRLARRVENDETRQDKPDE